MRTLATSTQLFWSLGHWRALQIIKIDPLSLLCQTIKVVDLFKGKSISMTFRPVTLGRVLALETSLWISESPPSKSESDDLRIRPSGYMSGRINCYSLHFITTSHKITPIPTNQIQLPIYPEKITSNNDMKSLLSDIRFCDHRDLGGWAFIFRSLKLLSPLQLQS